MWFERYQDARAHAEWKARDSGLDVAIRRVREFGRDGFNVKFASRNDSDYARAEIVTPRTATPRVIPECWTCGCDGPGEYYLDIEQHRAAGHDVREVTR